MKGAALLLIAGALLAGACRRPPKTTTFLRFERTACLGTCPVYTVTIYEDGTVLYEGGPNARPGRKWGKISPAEVERLMDETERIPAWRCDPDRIVTDYPTVVLTVSRRGQVRELRDDYGDPCVPFELRALEADIDQAGGVPHLVETWVEPAPP